MLLHAPRELSWWGVGGGVFIVLILITYNGNFQPPVDLSSATVIQKNHIELTSVYLEPAMTWLPSPPTMM